ncbi:DNA-binding protein BIN4 [Brachypodium distachyon]|uniref:DNA-binding protein BIN4 n=1 Tax=Brachypodium distachyon TaxID=15368 RepID=A0A0Q3LLH0_BRADI|nr:DNA-binding protein BIN4 [Brachypodium distachyon]KQJ93301.1 hypothetical protein BRADI_3g03740v3 [Brachypodium distachyon]|eukprot:XP_003570920.1 DNA-binding protein BIN4 [Brachypodium distachyon]
MAGQEEGDPDWLTAFQAPSLAPVMLSSGSDSSRENSPTRADQEEKEAGKGNSDTAGRTDDATKGKQPTATRRKALASKKGALGKHEGSSMEEQEDIPPKRRTPKKNLVALSDSSAGNSPSRASEANEEEDSLKDKNAKVVGTESCPDQRDDTLEQLEEGVAEEQMQDKLPGNSISQRLPLMITDKVQRSKALVECDGDSIDLSGDIGAVGRIVISNGPTGNQDLLLDLKGTVYKSTIVPSRTFCVVSVGQTEAKIEAIMNDFIQLEPHSNLFEAETMMEGTLDGFTFDSDGEGDRLHELHASQNDQNNDNDDEPKAKTKRKTEKPAGKGQKKAKVTGKTAKKGARKTQSTKRTKKAKK